MSDIENRITDYLCSGGLCNPELAIHDRVRDLLIDCRDEICRLRLTDAERATLFHLRNWLRHIPDVDALLARLSGDA